LNRNLTLESILKNVKKDTSLYFSFLLPFFLKYRLNKKLC